MTISYASIMASVAALTLAAASPSIGQTSQLEGRIPPQCAAALCEDGAALAATLDTLLRHEAACSGAPPFVLRSLYLAPFTAFDDAQMGRSNGHFGLPSSPVVLEIDHVGESLLRRYWSEIRLVAPTEVEQGIVPNTSCLFVFSPVTWLGPDKARVIVGESRNSPSHMTQWFVFLERVRNMWRASRVEVGVRS